MPNIVIKRVYDPPGPRDGMRILVDRLWPRGLSKKRAALDDWSKAVAPSPGLRKWFDHRPERFAEFRRRYRSELADNQATRDLLAAIGRRKATLLYGAKDPLVNHAKVLAEFLGKRKPG